MSVKRGQVNYRGQDIRIFHIFSLAISTAFELGYKQFAAIKPFSAGEIVKLGTGCQAKYKRLAKIHSVRDSLTKRIRDAGDRTNQTQANNFVVDMADVKPSEPYCEAKSVIAILNQQQSENEGFILILKSLTVVRDNCAQIST